MPKGLHTQGFAVLFDAPPALPALLRALDASTPTPPTRTEGWIGVGPSVRLPLPLGGSMIVELFARPWPDGMGDPKTDPMLFAAWSMGFFGPFAWPDGLARAAQQAWSWPGAADAVKRHRAFVRVTTTYATRGLDQPVLPARYDAVAELRAVTTVVRRLAELPGAVAVFAPGGETLHAPAQFGELVDSAAAEGRPPIELWTNVRFVRLAESGWFLMDTVGLGQLDRTDLEACFPQSALDPSEVAVFLRNVTLHLLGAGDVIETGDTLEGPGGKWRAWRTAKPVWAPQRDVVRIFPDGVGVPESLLPTEA